MGHSRGDEALTRGGPRRGRGRGRQDGGHDGSAPGVIHVFRGDREGVGEGSESGYRLLSAAPAITTHSDDSFGMASRNNGLGPFSSVIAAALGEDWCEIGSSTDNTSSSSSSSSSSCSSSNSKSSNADLSMGTRVASAVEQTVEAVVVAEVVEAETARSPRRTPTRRGSTDKWFAVFVGTIPGLYPNWESAAIVTQGISRASYRSFDTRDQALIALREFGFDVSDTGVIAGAATQGGSSK